MSKQSLFIRGGLLLFGLLAPLLSLSSCQRASTQLEPQVTYPAHPKEAAHAKPLITPLDSRSPFPALTPEEAESEWGREYRMGLAFAEDFDLYRAITCFKRALFLLGRENFARRQQIEYSVALSYYLGKKQGECIYSVEHTSLASVEASFPALSDLLLLLYESYKDLGEFAKAQAIYQLIEERDAGVAIKLSLLNSVERADLTALNCIGDCDPRRPYLKNILTGYQKNALSVRRAEMLNALLPGSGYWYVGLKHTAVTAFLVNSLFIAAGAHFIHSGNIAAGVITLSLESGWYLGGIYGAGLAAKRYNEILYSSYAQKINLRENYYPLFMLKYTF